MESLHSGKKIRGKTGRKFDNAPHFHAFFPRNCLPDRCCCFLLSTRDLATFALFAAIGICFLCSFCLLLIPPVCCHSRIQVSKQRSSSVKTLLELNLFTSPLKSELSAKTINCHLATNGIPRTYLLLFYGGSSLVLPSLLPPCSH